MCANSTLKLFALLWIAESFWTLSAGNKFQLLIISINFQLRRLLRHYRLLCCSLALGLTRGLNRAMAIHWDCAAIITCPGASLQGLFACLKKNKSWWPPRRPRLPLVPCPWSTRCLRGLCVNWFNFKIAIFVTVESKILKVISINPRIYHNQCEQIWRKFPTLAIFVRVY